MDTLELLRELSEAVGLSGHEESVRRHIQGLWEPFVDEVRTDALGNLIALQRGNGDDQNRPAIMGAAHMDEVGLIVTGIEEGFLRVSALGGTDRRILLGLEVVVHGREDLPGIIGTRPPHVLKQEARKKIVPWEEIFVDVGLPHEEVKQRVRVGDPISLHRPLIELQGKRVAGKALDNRASIAALTLALETLYTREHAWDFYAVATVQEEVGAKGALTSAYGVHPQAAVALDVTFAKQPDDSDTGAFEMNKGPTLGIGPNFHPDLLQKLREAADAEEIPYQMEPIPGRSGTDAWSIQIAREGVPSTLICIPVRYMHQPVESLDLRDLERTGRLLTAFAARLTADYRPQWEDES